MKELLCKSNDEDLVGEYLESNKYLCRKCFSSFEKLLKLKGELHQLQVRLTTCLTDAYTKKADDLRASLCRKRPREDDHTSPSPKRKRQVPHTPVQNWTKRTCTTPSVAVSEISVYTI